MPRSLHVRADRGVVRAEGRSRRHLCVDVVAPRSSPRAALSLSLVLDQSGSMAGPKLNLAREGAIRAIRSLRVEDRLGVVAYSDEVQVLLRSAPAEEPAKRTAERRLRDLRSGGNTDLCGGWLRGCEQVGFGLDGGRLGRCLLLTDGLANVGTTDRPTIVTHAAELRRRGVTTSTLGVGRDFDERLLSEMAEAGGGSFYFAETPSQLSDFIAGETGEAARVVAREAALVVDLPPGASVTSPNPFRVRSEQTRAVFELGDLVADQVLSLVLTVEFPGGPEGESAPVQLWLWDPGGVLEGALTPDLRYAEREAYAAAPRDQQVGREAATAYAAAARRRAAELAREGQTGKGRAVLLNMADDLRRHAGGDSMLETLAGELDREAAKLERMDSLDYKRLEYSTFGSLRSRGEDGMTIGTLAFTESTLVLAMRGALRGPDQAPFFVAVVTSDKEATRLVESAGRALAAASPRFFGYSVADGGARILDPGPGVALSRDDELALAYALATTGDSVKIACVRGLLDDGATSHWHAKENVAIVSLSAWSEQANIPAEAFVACEMVLQGQRRGCGEWDPSVPVHRDTLRCWNEFGESPADLEGRIRAGDLCPSCRKLLGMLRIDAAEFLSLLAAVRRLTERPDESQS